ncbi:MAG: hypothetical protein EBZ07_04640, partial [Verrucomicrobia bacterium]|nr:hypothetical protein [Verrucomicrobiota bacterium]
MSYWKMSVGVLVALTSGSMAAMEFKEADLTTVKNIVERNEGTGVVPAKVNDKIHENSKVSTSAASMAELTFADSSITRMGANTQFSFQSKERLVKLKQGTVLIHTPPGNGGATVDCGGVTAAVTGTTFMASHDSAGNVMFVLLEGQGGLKVTVGGVSTVIRPGQAASVGADANKQSSEKETSTSPGGDKKPSSAGASSSAGGDRGGSEGAAGKNADAGSTPGGGEGGGSAASAPTAAPKIQVFDVDVKKVVATTPLIVEFKKELPSVSKIEKVIETQQARVQEGKLEKTDTEVVVIKHEDGDILVGAPKVKTEDSVVVNRQEDKMGAGAGGSGEKIDIETAAGPGAGNPSSGGGGAPVAANPPASSAPAQSSPSSSNPPPVNPGQIVNNNPSPVTPSKIAITAKVNDTSRVYNQANPAFGFSITAGSLLAGHSLVTDFLTTATPTSGVAGSPYGVTFSNPRVVDSSGNDVSARYNLTTVAGVLNVLKAGQSVSFGSVGSLAFGQSVDLVASALAGAVNYEVVSGPASLVNGKLVASSGTGSVVVRAVTAGNDNYLGASAVQTITLAKADQSVSFTLPSNLTFNASTGLSATALDSGTVSFQVLSGPGTIDVNGNLVATSGTGSVVVRATAAGDSNYNGAFQDQTITLAKASQSVSLTVPSNLTFNTSTGLSATALD